MQQHAFQGVSSLFKIMHLMNRRIPVLQDTQYLKHCIRLKTLSKLKIRIFSQVSCFKVQVTWTLIKDRLFVNISHLKAWIYAFLKWKFQMICVLFMISPLSQGRILTRFHINLSAFNTDNVISASSHDMKISKTATQSLNKIYTKTMCFV